MSKHNRMLERHHKGFYRIFKFIKDKYGDEACYNEESGESWQYMGTYIGPDGSSEFHEMRHRDVPGKARVYERIPAIDTDFESVDNNDPAVPTLAQIEREPKGVFDFDSYNGVRK